MQRAGLCARGKPGVLDVALDQSTALQHLADPYSDLLSQILQVVRLRPGHATEHGWVGAIGHLHAIQEQHVLPELLVQYHLPE